MNRLILLLILTTLILGSCTKIHPDEPQTFGIVGTDAFAYQKAGMLTVGIITTPADYDRVLEVETKFASGVLRHRIVLKAGKDRAVSEAMVWDDLVSWRVLGFERLNY